MITERLFDRAVVVHVMDKKQKSRKQKGNHNRARSKNNRSDKRNDTKIDWPEYNKGRNAEENNYLKNLDMIADKVRSTACMALGACYRRVSAISVEG